MMTKNVEHTHTRTEGHFCGTDYTRERKTFGPENLSRAHQRKSEAKKKLIVHKIFAFASHPHLGNPDRGILVGCVPNDRKKSFFGSFLFVVGGMTLAADLFTINVWNQNFIVGILERPRKLEIFMAKNTLSSIHFIQS